MPPRLIVTRWLWLLCSFQGPPRGRWAGRVDTKADQAGTGLSKLNSMHGLELGEMPRGARRRGRSRDARRRLGRPGSVDVLAARSVSGGGDRGDEGHDLPHGAVPYMPHTGLPRKEVIQPHLPVRLPCYDFTPVTSPTFDGSLPKGLGHRLRVLLTPMV